MAAVRRRKFWGWGYEDEQPAREQVEQIAVGIRETLGFGSERIDAPPRISDLDLPVSRLSAPASLADAFSADPYDRASHAYGKSYRDVVRGLRGEFPHPPDLVTHPRDETELAAILDWCAQVRAAVIPFGGGTSVVGGVEPLVGDAYAGTVSVDLGRLDQVLDVDHSSLAVRVQAGALLPTVDERLRPHGLTLRHFPQSYQFASLGGSIATRAGGHYATGRTRIDDFVESLRAVTPSGVWESRRLPGSGAGPSPDRLLLGSEGTLGIITEAWLRVQQRPRFRASASVEFPSFTDGAEAARALVGSGLQPANCRLLDPGEAALNAKQGLGATGSNGTAVLLLGFESAQHPQDALLEHAVECARAAGGVLRGAPAIRGPEDGSGRGDTEGRWRDGFLAAPYLRDVLVAAGILVETFETAVTWDRFADFEARVRAATQAAAVQACRTAIVNCRLTHVYPDGAALYFTVLAPARRGSELDQWQTIKDAAAEALLAAGGTITHHHAVGRDHRPWYDRQRPDLFAEALQAIKRAVDPAGILNPGVLIDPS